MMILWDKIRGRTMRTAGSSVERVIAWLNSALRGSSGYFQHPYQLVFSSIGGVVRSRLRTILRRPRRRPGRGRCRLDNTRLLDAFLAIPGPITMSEARRSACHPTWEPLTGDQVAAEPHSRYVVRRQQSPFPTSISHSIPLDVAGMK